VSVLNDVELPEVATFRPGRVLLVDDSPALRALTRMVLDGKGFEVVGEAGDGLAGVTMAAELQPDLVLLDLAMPVMDGLEALPKVREAAPHAKVVILSGFDRRAMEQQVVDAGADAYLQKGLPPDAMLAAVQALFPDGSQTPWPTAGLAPRTEPPSVATVDQQVQALEEDLEELLYVISHDLSEPVHVVKGFAERLARRASSDEEGEFCEFIVDAANRMQQLLDDLLEYARAGRGDLPCELLDVRRVVDNVLAGLNGAIISSRGRVDVGALPRSVVASRLVVNQVLHNLIANALKFARPGVLPVIQLDAEYNSDRVTFHVRDNGLGIDPVQHQRIFQPFTRLNAREGYPGSGVGLAICRRLVERHGGRIWLESSSAGSTFHVELPA
jgi:two-component system sensor histidine kinase/response regulator